MLKRIFHIFTFVLLSKLLGAQCPQLYDYLGNLSGNPYWVSCTGGAYTLNFQSNTGWGAYSIDFGDGTPVFNSSSYTANTLVTHPYSATIDTFVVTLTIASNSCVLTGVVVMEKPVNASIQIPIGGVTTACAPKALLFTNSSTDVSKTTIFTWNFGDGSPVQTFSYANVGQTISHTYNKNTVNCQTMVTLTAKNYCTSIPTIANFNPIQIYDIDDAAITPDSPIKCWPDNSFTFNNTTNRNCVPQGNTFQRQEKWNFGNYWGYGHDSIINWRPWPPTVPITVAYPSVGSYTIQLQDSNLCGVDVITIPVSIVNPPTAGILGPASPLCQGSTLTFTNTSSTGYSYRWNFGAGGGFVNLGSGDKTFTYSSPGTYTVSLIVFIAGAGSACSDTSSIVVTILPIPTASFTATPNKGCDFINGVTFTDNSTNAVQWQWNLGNGNTFNGQNPPAQNYATVGISVVTLTVTAANTCIHTFNSPITVYQTPTASFSISSACVGAIATFSNNSTNAAGDPIVSWHWDFGDASPTSISTAQNPTHTYSLQNTYTVQLIASTANCIDTVVQNIIINIKPTADFTVNPTSGCPNLFVNLTNTSSNATSYNWNFGNGNTSSATHTTQAYTNTLSVNQPYTISLTAYTGLGCSDTKTTSVTVFTKPIAAFSLYAPTGCSPVSATFTNTSLGALNYIWTFGDGASSTSTISVFSHTYTNSTLFIQTYIAKLVAISSNGCKDSITQSIVVYPKPGFGFTMLPGSGCSPLNVNFPPVLGAVTYQWDFGDGSPLVFGPNPTHTFTNIATSDKTFTVQLIASNAFSCIDTAYGYPVVFAKPQANFVTTPTVGCSPLAVTYTNTSIAGSTYLWKFGDGATTNSTNATHTYSNSSNIANQSFSCTLVTTTSNGCKDSITKTILVYFKPKATFSLDTPKCVSKTISFTNNSLGYTNNSWNFGDSSSLSTQTSPAHTYTNNTVNNSTYTVQLITISASLCADTAYGYPIVYAKPIANFVLTPTAGCSPLPVTYTNTSITSSSYMWKFGDGGTTNTLNASHTYSTASNTTNQTFNCNLIAMTTNGCKDSISKPILLYFKPKANFTPDTPKCVSKTITFTNNSLGYISNSWNFGDSSPLSSQTSPTHTYTNTTLNNMTFTVQLIVSSPSSCMDTTYGYPTVYAKPIANFSLTPAIGCSPLTVTYMNTSPTATSYLWKYGDGTTSNAFNANHIYTNASNITNQTFSCTLITSIPNGCLDSMSKTVLVYFKPKASFSLDTPKCISTIITFTNTSLGASNNNWSFGDGSPLSTQLNPIHTYTNNTTSNTNYTVQLITTSTSSCADTTYGYPTAYARPIANFVLTPTVGCSPLLVSTNNSSQYATSYLWKFGDGTFNNALDTSHIYSTASHTINQTFNCTLVAINSNGCKDSISKSVLLFFKPKANFTVDTPSCSPKLLTFTNTSVGATNYNWDFGNSTSINMSPTHAFINSTLSNVTHTVELIVKSVNNCQDTVRIPIIVHPKPEFTIIANPDSGCTALSVNFPNITGVVSYQWNFGDGNISFTGNTNNVFYNNSPSDKTFTVQLIGTDGYGCKDTSSKVISVFSQPIAVFQANPNTVYVPNTPVNCSNLSSGAISYFWDFGDNSTSTEVNPSHTYQTPGEYQIYLIATNKHGCKDTFDLPSKIIAEVETGIEIPNAFTPNSNGGNGGTFGANDINNDVFHPVMKGIDKYELNIFSRWGELLFVSKDITIGWDGYYKGKLCTQDVYVWKIIATTVDGKKINKTGDLLLLR